MSLADATWLLLLLPVLLIAGLGVWTARRHHATLQAAFGHLAERIVPPGTVRRRAWRHALSVAGLALLVLALAEPRAGMIVQKVEAKGVDLVIILDLSRSMDARDVDPSRLERARREVLDLLDLLEGDRVGLVIFAGGAYPRMPLSMDHAALRLLVNEVNTEVFQAQGSALGLAIEEATRMVTAQTDDAGRALLVLSDGEVHEPASALAAAEAAAAQGIAIYGMVVGTEAAPIPEGNGSHLVDPATGAKVMTAPSSAVLTDIARATGGAVAQSVASDQDMRGLYGEIRDHVRAGVARSSEQERWNTLFMWPLGLGALLLLIGSWIGDGRRLAMLTLLLLAMPVRADDVRDADALYRAGRFAEAAEVYTELLATAPDDPDLLGRLAAARYRAGDYTGAARGYQRQAELTQDPDAAFNAGNAWWQAGQLDRALQSYDRALERSPQHEAAQGNKGLLQQELQQRRMVQQQQQQQGEQGEQQEGQQGEPQDGQQGQPQEGQQGDAQQAAQPSSDPSGQQGQADSQQQGEPQEAPQDPQQQQEPKPGDGSQQGGAPPPDGTRQEQGDAQATLPGEEPGGEPQPGEAAGEPTAAAADESPSGQAGRTLDGVEEGRPRVFIPGRPSEKPW